MSVPSLGVHATSASLVLAFCIAIWGRPLQGEEFSTHTMQINGVERTYCVHRAKVPKANLPLVVVLHGGGGNGKLLKDTYGFRPFVATGECIAVYPDAIKGSWMPDDVAFLDAVVGEVFARESVSRERLFITGVSRGGLMTFVMAAKSKHTIRAAGTVIASQLGSLAKEYPISRPVDFAMIAGTADPLMPYRGGWGAMGKPGATGEADARILSVEDAIGLLLKVNEITSEPAVSSLGNTVPEDGCTNEVRCWTNPKTGRRVMLVKVEGGGHVAPGGRQYLPVSIIGPVCMDFDHAEVMWEFFRTAGQTEPRPILDAKSEKALRDRVAALFEALRSGDIATCVELSDPAAIKERGREKVEQFFTTVSGLVKLAKPAADDRVIRTITAIEGGKAARVQLQARTQGKWQPPGVELWTNVNGAWCYRETLK